ncbi:MAG: acetyl-CoA carboxylase biotin carboxyl carrier protein [Acidobacteria bacterium]|nr:MAG: acetyl-CoA carboxylase biotin carboxyl carrier protein [Acidobacteriota bacterium]
MDLEQLKQILNLVREHELSEIEIEHEGLRLKIRKNGAGPPVVALPAASVPVALSSTASAAPSPAAAATSMPSAAVSEAAPEAEVELAVVKSPIVGTFYRSPEPGAASFVEIGSTVKKGQVLCIIEAMKLMNEIDSEYDGEVANIYVENGQPVQYGERLFAIRTR